MTNSLTIFQTMMNNIFQDLIVEDIMIVYLNNILIFIQTLEEYHRAVCRVIKVIVKHKLFLCLKKYKFDKQRIYYKLHSTCTFTTSKLILTNQVALESPNEDYLYIYGIYKSNNRLLRYQTISNYNFYWLLSQE